MFKKNISTIPISLILSSLLFFSSTVFAQEAADTTSDAVSESDSISSSDGDDKTAMREMENMMDEERAYFKKADSAIVSQSNSTNSNDLVDEYADNRVNEPGEVQINDYGNDNNGAKSSSANELAHLKMPAKSNGLRLEIGFHYAPLFAGGLSVTFGRQFNSIGDHFALGLYGQISLQVGTAYTQLPFGLAGEEIILLKFHISRNYITFSPYIGMGITTELVGFAFPVAGFILVGGVSFDAYVRSNLYVGFDIGIIETLYKTFLVEIEVDHRPQIQGNLHFGFKFHKKNKNK